MPPNYQEDKNKVDTPPNMPAAACPKGLFSPYQKHPKVLHYSWPCMRGMEWPRTHSTQMVLRNSLSVYGKRFLRPNEKILLNTPIMGTCVLRGVRLTTKARPLKLKAGDFGMHVCNNTLALFIGRILSHLIHGPIIHPSGFVVYWNFSVLLATNLSLSSTMVSCKIGQVHSRCDARNLLRGWPCVFAHLALYA